MALSAFWHDLTHAAFWLELARSDVAAFIQLTPYAYAAIEAAHLVAIAFFFGPIALLDLKLLGCLPRFPLEPGRRLALSLAAPAFVLIAASGALMFVSSADRYAASSVFVHKIAAIVAGGVNALVLHVADRGMGNGRGAGRGPRLPRIAAVVSLLVWMSVIVLGRAMGYELREPPEMDFDSLPGFVY